MRPTRSRSSLSPSLPPSRPPRAPRAPGVPGRRHLPHAASAVCALALAGCASAGSRAPVFAEAGPPPDGVRALLSVIEYDVIGVSTAELRQAIARAGPQIDGRRWGGVTHWRARWRWTASPGVAGCTLRDVRVELDVQVEVPRWVPPAGAAPDSATLRWWHEYRDRLLAHEAGHVRIAQEAGGAIVRALRPLAGGTCTLLASQANAVAQRALDAGSARQRAYDAETLHGAHPTRPALPPRAARGRAAGG